MGLTIREIIAPTDIQLRQLAQVAVLAFEGDPFVEISTAGDATLSFPYHLAQITGASRVGKILVAQDRDELVGFATYTPHGTGLFGVNNESMQSFLNHCPNTLKVWWTEQFLPAYPENTAKFLGADVKNAWHFQLLAISPKHQGKGVGSSLLIAGRESFHTQGISLYLETQKIENIILYKKLGFKVRGTAVTESGGRQFFLTTMFSQSPKAARL
ncbi:acyl-CoA N-acyltransferase [Mycena crocata]|nr:acyl-CoA N-acyltransferase [Mycena crocata]